MFLLGSFTQGLTNGGRFVSDLADAYTRRQYYGEHTRKLKLENDWTQMASDRAKAAFAEDDARRKAEGSAPQPAVQQQPTTTTDFGPIKPTDLSDVPTPAYMQGLHTMGGVGNPELRGVGGSGQISAPSQNLGASGGGGFAGGGSGGGGGGGYTAPANPASPVPVANNAGRPVWAEVNQNDPTAGDFGSAISTGIDGFRTAYRNFVAPPNQPKSPARTRREQRQQAIPIPETATAPTPQVETPPAAPMTDHMAGGKPIRTEVQDWRTTYRNFVAPPDQPKSPARQKREEKRQTTKRKSDGPFDGKGNGRRHETKEAKVVDNG